MGTLVGGLDRILRFNRRARPMARTKSILEPMGRITAAPLVDARNVVVSHYARSAAEEPVDGNLVRQFGVEFRTHRSRAVSGRMMRAGQIEPIFYHGLTRVRRLNRFAADRVRRLLHLFDLGTPAGKPLVWCSIPCDVRLTESYPHRTRRIRLSLQFTPYKFNP